MDQPPHCENIDKSNPELKARLAKSSYEEKVNLYKDPKCEGFQVSTPTDKPNLENTTTPHTTDFTTQQKTAPKVFDVLPIIIVGGISLMILCTIRK